MTEQPIRFLRLQGIALDWSKHNEHSRNIFSVHGFLCLSVMYHISIKMSLHQFDGGMLISLVAPFLALTLMAAILVL